MNDPDEFEMFRYIDSINVYKSLIEEFQKLYEQTPASDHFIRARILNGMKKSKRELTKTQARRNLPTNLVPGVLMLIFWPLSCSWL
jgi:hypothetical protein